MNMCFSAYVCICLYMHRLQLEKDIGVCLSLSRVRIATPKTVACQAPLSTKFSTQKYWRVDSLCPSPGERDISYL